jgi:uncharacterized protein (TIGR03083 family)
VGRPAGEEENMAGPSGGGEPVVAHLVEVWASIIAACQQVSTDQWALETDCPGWAVKDQLSHLVGIERMILGDPSPPLPSEPPSHVRNDLGLLNESWVEVRRSVPGDLVLAEFVEVTGRRIDALDSMGEEDFDRMGWSPIGERPYRQFMESRLFDCWAHEQDIRRALGRPGGRNGAAESVVLDRCEQTMTYVIGKRVAPPDGTSVLFVVTGALGRHALVSMADGRASLVPVSTDSSPSVTVTLDQETFWRLALGRVDPSVAVGSGEVGVDGDKALGYRTLESMSFMT